MSNSNSNSNSKSRQKMKSMSFRNSRIDLTSTPVVINSNPIDEIVTQLNSIDSNQIDSSKLESTTSIPSMRVCNEISKMNVENGNKNINQRFEDLYSVLNFSNQDWYIDVEQFNDPSTSSNEIYIDNRGVKYKIKSSSSTSPGQIVNDIDGRDDSFNSHLDIYNYIRTTDGVIHEIDSQIQYNLSNISTVEFKTTFDSSLYTINNRSYNQIECRLNLNSHSQMYKNLQFDSSLTQEFDSFVIQISIDCNPFLVDRSLFSNIHSIKKVLIRNHHDWLKPIRVIENSSVVNVEVENSFNVGIGGGLISLNNCDSLESIHYNSIQDCHRFNYKQLDHLFNNTTRIKSISNLEYNNTQLGNYTMYYSELWRFIPFTSTIVNLTLVGPSNIQKVGSPEHLNKDIFRHDIDVLIDSDNFRNVSWITLENVKLVINNFDHDVERVFHFVDHLFFKNVHVRLGSTQHQLLDSFTEIDRCQLHFDSEFTFDSRSYCNNSVFIYEDGVTITKPILDCEANNTSIYLNNVVDVLPNGSFDQADHCKLISQSTTSFGKCFTNGLNNSIYTPLVESIQSNTINIKAIDKVYFETESSRTNWKTFADSVQHKFTVEKVSIEHFAVGVDVEGLLDKLHPIEFILCYNVNFISDGEVNSKCYESTNCKLILKNNEPSNNFFDSHCVDCEIVRQ